MAAATSAVIAFAIHEYLEILLQESAAPREIVKADNYLDDYFFAARDSGGIQKFVILWGFPDEEELNSCFT
ncbi:MAG: hypothetical protein GY754_42115 [bacterium]|nr:hypothetical protein [bacterium]